MKKIIAAILLLCISLSGYAWDRNLYVYGEMGGGNGNFGSFKMGLNCIYSGFIISGTYYYQSANATYVPPDYEPGLVIFGSRTPQQSLDYFCLTAGKVIYFANGHMRCLLKGGISVGETTYPESYTRIPQGWFDSNYDISFKTISLAGFHMNPTIEIPIGAGFGLSAGLWADINTARSSYGIEGSLLFGKVSHRRRR